MGWKTINGRRYDYKSAREQLKKQVEKIAVELPQKLNNDELLAYGQACVNAALAPLDATKVTTTIMRDAAGNPMCDFRGPDHLTEKVLKYIESRQST